MVNVDLSEVKYPAITICSEQTTKYAFAERLGNYLDPNKGHPDLLRKWKKEYLDTVLKILEDYHAHLYGSNYKGRCKKTTYRVDKTCEVSAIYIS